MWSEDKDLLWREIHQVGELVPGFRLFLEPTAEAPFGRWLGTIRSNFENEYKVEVRYTAGFPWEPPKVFIVEPQILVSPHRFDGGSLCLFVKEDAWRFTSAAAVINRAVQWLFCQEVWELTGGYERYTQTGSVRQTWDFWPSPQEPH